MTNGEKLKETFPSCKTTQPREDIIEITIDGIIETCVMLDWWNALYRDKTETKRKGQRMNEIKCPYDLNQFLLGEPIFENTFPEEECEQRKFYGDCYHCFSTAIASRDHQLKNTTINKIKAIVAEWKADTWTENLSYECMVKIAELVDPQESEDKE